MITQEEYNNHDCHKDLCAICEAWFEQVDKAREVRDEMREQGFGDGVGVETDSKSPGS